jgi:hypothetical protein
MGSQLVINLIWLYRDCAVYCALMPKTQAYFIRLVRYMPTFIEDGNPAHGYKSIRNPCALFREKYGIRLLNHTATSPDLNPIEKRWRAMKQSLH